MLLSLVTNTFTRGVIAFFERKRQAHRMYLLMTFLGFKVAELHGNLSQTQRSDAAERFKAGEVQLLMATDLAARGLDFSVGWW
jgi:superfamily II DNA/RNA helicase